MGEWKSKLYKEYDVALDNVKTAEDSLSALKQEANRNKQAAKKKVAQANSRTNRNGAGRNQLSKKTLKARAKKLGIYDHRDQTLFRDQLKSGNMDFEFWKQKYPDTEKYFIQHGFKKPPAGVPPVNKPKATGGKPPVNKPKATGGKRLKNINSAVSTKASKIKIVATGTQAVKAATVTVENAKVIFKMKKHSMLKGPHMAKTVVKFVSLCGTLSDKNSLKCLRLSFHILMTLKGTQFTIDDRSKYYKRFMKWNKDFKTLFHNSIAEESASTCWKKGGDRSERFKCKSGLATKGLKAYIMENAKTSGGRRLLSKVGMDWDEAWQSFVSNVQSAGDGTYQFSCSNSPELCDCASSVGTGSTSADTQYFVNEDMGVYLGVFEDGGAAAYEICETGGECHAYGDVNDGMVARRRRRLLSRG